VPAGTRKNPSFWKEFRHFISFIGLRQKNFTPFLSSIRALIVFESRN